MSSKPTAKSSYPAWVRILSITLAALIASGMLTYTILFLIQLFR